MVYRVIGLMSGSSLDGLDIVHVQLEEVRGNWSFEILHAACIPYSPEWASKLAQAAALPVGSFLLLHTAYGKYLGEQVLAFIQEYQLDHQVHFIASHGHTVYHNPAQRTTFQLGDGASLAAIVGLPVINDLRAMDVALGGQGAPIVPIGDKLLFGDYSYLLNIGGIANLTIQQQGQQTVAFDVCPANQLLNRLAGKLGKDMDEDGALAAAGKSVDHLLDVLNSDSYYQQSPPKSLSNEAAMAIGEPLLAADEEVADLLHTCSLHIATQVAAAVAAYPNGGQPAQLLATGGGAFNTFLIQQLTELLQPMGVTVVVPVPDIIQYKEAVVMALIGVLRWREETNVLCSVTGAQRDSIGGALWLSAS